MAKFRLLPTIVLMAAAMVASAANAAAAKRLTYGQARDFLAAHTKVVEITSAEGARVAICPEFQGRIMTSSTGDLKGASLGWINVPFIEKGEKSSQFNNYGGEDRLWLGPEGGQFSLWFRNQEEQKFDNWHTPAALNDGGFQIVSKENEPGYKLRRRMQLTNATGAKFDLEVGRDLHLLSLIHFAKLFGAEAAETVRSTKLRYVGFKSVNTIANRGEMMTAERGLVAIWSLGQFPPSDSTHIIVPYRAGTPDDRGAVVKSDYFGAVPDDRLRISDQAVFFKGDGKLRSKIGVSQRRARNVAAALDLEHRVLTLVHFSLPEDPYRFSYVNNAWQTPQAEPYLGDVFNSYNDGPTEPGKDALGGFFELESMSPAAELPTGKSLTHVHATFHFEGGVPALAALLKAAIGVDQAAQPPSSEAVRSARRAD